MTILEDITAQRRRDVHHARAQVSTHELAKLAGATLAAYGQPLNLFERLWEEAPEVAIAAEFKRASPSKGVIAPNANAADIASKYANAGAGVISVLTEPKWFKGTLQDMLTVRNAITSYKRRPAVLRKDFIIDEYQLDEAVAFGADTVLLMLSILDPATFRALLAVDEAANNTMQAARDRGMEPLVEVVSEAELEVALEAGAKVIGVNNRDLHTFQVDMDRTIRIASILQERGLLGREGVALMALSGIAAREDVIKYTSCGCRGVLVGESLMRSADPYLAVQGLKGVAVQAKTFVKICGITNAEDAMVAARSGADFIGLIFAEKSPRKVTPEQAKEIVTEVRKFGERSDRIDFSEFYPTPAVNVIEWFQSCANMLQSKKKPVVVGVFQNHSVGFINSVIDSAGIDLVQLHGDESYEFAHQLKVPAINVEHIPADSGNLAGEVLSNIRAGWTVAVLLDTAVNGQKGGTGKTFNWQVAKTLADKGLPVIVAGGISVDNVDKVIQEASPWGIDVSGSLEELPGKKDPSKIQELMHRVRAATAKK